MNYQKQNMDFQLGLLHFVHLLVTVDGHIDDRERQTIQSIKREESISGKLFQFFMDSVNTKSEREVFAEGIDRLNRCNEEERLCAFVHLYQLAQADEHLDVKEIKLLLYSLDQTKIEFDDVVLAAQLAIAQKQARNQKIIN
ncbi:MAG TPA: hypothetical protein VFU05_18775 [Cyclobacteriaceae bacterium]|nr:hypothetical protein [Cyclobacteriaceae bacterium]